MVYCFYTVKIQKLFEIGKYSAKKNDFGAEPARHAPVLKAAYDKETIAMTFEHTPPLIIYTDGSCSRNPGPGGWGCVILDGEQEHTLSGGEPETTNNRMELCAAIEALTAVNKSESWKQRSITVYCDSQYVKNGINSWIQTWKKNDWKTAGKAPVKNKDLWTRLDELNSSLCVQWQWVKGHAGNVYNELCDRLAAAQTAHFASRQPTQP